MRMDNKEVMIMSEVTAPIMTDATGQSIDSKLNSLLGKMDNLAAAFQPNASGIVYSNTTSGLTGDDVQEAIDEMAADVSEIKQSLSHLGRMYFNADSNYTDVILMPILVNMAFTNGDSVHDMSQYIPSGYQYSSIMFANIRESQSLSITGSRINNNNAVVKVSNRSYTGSIDVHLLCILLPVTP